MYHNGAEDKLSSYSMRAVDQPGSTNQNDCKVSSIVTILKVTRILITFYNELPNEHNHKLCTIKAYTQ